MKILNFTNKTGTGAIKEAMLTCMLLLGVFINANAQSTEDPVTDCTMVCSGELITSVDASTCSKTIGFDDLLTNPCYSDGYTVQILTLNDHVIATGNDEVTVELVGRFVYKVTHDIDGSSRACWGYITFEDKLGPIKDLQLDQEPPTLVCGEESIDPSGVDDLATEYVSCVVKEEFGVEALEPWFDVLETSDYKDCTGVDKVFSFTESFEFCKDDISADMMEIANANPPEGWEPTHIYKRSWFASDDSGKLSDTCAQYVVVVRPQESEITIEEYIFAECGDDESEVLAQAYPYFTDLENVDSEIFTCPSSSNTRITLTPNEHYCKYAVSVTHNERVGICETSGTKVFKAISSWTVMDWCTAMPISGNGAAQDSFSRFTNAIEVYDSVDPVATGTPVVSTASSLFDCVGTVAVGPQTFDDCSGIASVMTTATYIVPGANAHSSQFERVTSETNGITLTDVPLNTFIDIVYIATDSCGNVGSDTTFAFVNDDRAPVCIANDELYVGMVRLDQSNPDSLGARVYGEDLDDTSKDNCFPVILEVRRTDQAEASTQPDTLWAEYVEFSRNDLTEDNCSGTYRVELRVTEDKSDFLPHLTPEQLELVDYANQATSSTCWTTIILEDNTAPVIGSVEDKVISCNMPEAIFDDLGIEGCFDGVDMTIDTLTAGECDYDLTMQIRKTWKPYKFAHDIKVYTDSIAQNITIENAHDTKFTFPIDVVMDCSDATVPAAADISDIVDEQGCSNWLMEVSDREFAANDGDACRKILRRYTFVNWCTWDPSNTELAYVTKPENGVWSPEQQVVLHYKDADLDHVNDIDDLNDGDLYNVESSEAGYASDGAWVQIDNGDDVQGLTVYNHEDDIRGEAASSVDGYQYGYFVYTQVIKIQDDVAPVSTTPEVKQTCDPFNTDCDLSSFVEITFGGSDNCSDLTYQVEIQKNQEGAYVDDTYGTFGGNILSGYYPGGEHNFAITTMDGCGNAVMDTIAIDIQKECKKPTPVCRAAFTTAMEDGSVMIWASDIESGSSSDNCSAYADLTFGIELLSDQNGDNIIDARDASASAPEDTVAQLTCDNIGVSIIALWVTDESGNEQFCLAPVTVVDNRDFCGSQIAQVSGAIVNEDDEEIDAVTVNVSAAGMSPVAQVFNGFFDFLEIPMHSDITVSPEKNVGYLNGVSTSDLVLLQRHILGVNELNSPYKLIAADANRDDKVDTRDLLHVSRLILGITDELPNNSSWRFVAKDHTFANPTSPWGFPESSSFDNLDADIEADFIGVKIGDISGNASPNRLLGDDDNVVSRTVSLATQNVTLAAGEATDVVFTADDMTDITGYQFTIALTEGVVFNGLSFGPESDLTDANFGLTKLDENLITVSWSSSDAIDLTSGTELFQISVVSAQASTVQSAIQLNSAFTHAEAYDNDVNTLDVQLNIISEDANFELYQNIPNPVSNETIIGFNLPAAGSASLRIMDVSGRVLKAINGNYPKGYNQITLDRSELGAPGVLYYRLDANQSSASKKMIIID